MRVWFSVLGGGAGALALVLQWQPAVMDYRPYELIDYSAPEEPVCPRNLEIIVQPLTILNKGGRAGLVQKVELELVDLDDRTRVRRFHSGAIGTWTPPIGTNSSDKKCLSSSTAKLFSPIPVFGGNAARETIVFYSEPGSERLLRPNGRFEIRMNVEQFAGNWWGQFGERPERLALPALVFNTPDFDRKMSEGLIGIPTDGFYGIPANR